MVIFNQVTPDGLSLLVYKKEIYNESYRFSTYSGCPYFFYYLC
ncbi:hypothetical protein ALT1545_60161 [Alteromonas macleodii]